MGPGLRAGFYKERSSNHMTDPGVQECDANDKAEEGHTYSKQAAATHGHHDTVLVAVKAKDGWLVDHGLSIPIRMLIADKRHHGRQHHCSVEEQKK